ncbi:hypothetical protein DESUT3_35520 [Desulfuromonas versatilis]|uniref:Protein CR006 P-loop domain-containing protein n=1 Tax=Desulfuromonas versatilis TaxID=2802975 RepID=A0ABN6E2A8_9BACT|nr:AAA family ATPase [Desulfuromonas versatilis]BCR06483.1 hypothetical protein DESUT3_35520 [Desulfuromonas versatilis]
MITELQMDGVASFKHATSLKTDKKINLIYGLNGTGKSTISNYLYGQAGENFTKCRKIQENSDPILVYNQKFIRDNFFVADSLRGIFSLSKENRAAEEKIKKASATLEEAEIRLNTKQIEKQKVSQAFEGQKQKAVDEVWRIKATYSGGDRVLEYCFDGLKGQKDRLFSHLVAIAKPESEPGKSVKAIRDEVEGLRGDSAQPQEILPELAFVAHDVESHPILVKPIVGNDDSGVAALIDKLGNADWVKQGLEYLPENIGETSHPCPFCQEKTITSEVINSIINYFDETYQADIDTLEGLKKKYLEARNELQDLNTYLGHPFAKESIATLTTRHQELLATLGSNAIAIEQKIRNPKAPQALFDSTAKISAFNDEVRSINAAILTYNDRLKNSKNSLEILKAEFWSMMRWQYDQTLSRLDKDRQEANKSIMAFEGEISQIYTEISSAKGLIASAQKETVNVDDAVSSINAGLLDLGIDDFMIKKHSDRLYRVVRSGESGDAFHSLSEGEKMMISFLYFCELCKGRVSTEDTHARRIVVIDDPISSLSHVFIFNVGQLIRTVFFKSERFSQVFVLTHSLYFFYELTDPNHERRKENQKLFRISKSATGSDIQEMTYEEIQNDYQAYWSVVNDTTQPPALIANCMRNIVEYFFNFVRRKDLNNVFQMPELKDMKFQAFCRYVNRESHSLGQNIIDMKEFNYEIFKDGLRLVFEKTGYSDHFKAMSRL